jgi:hypothetical protein
MKSTFIIKTLIVFVFFSNFSNAQNYVKAVCKLNSGEILEGMLKNNFKNEDVFIYLNKNNQDIKINIININELIINQNQKYISKLVEFHPNRLLSSDKNSEEISADLTQRVSKQLLLKVLVEGEVNLYETSINGISFYYYKRNNENNFEYLEYYNYSHDNLIKVNDYFKRQLLKNVNCENNITDKYNKINYNTNDLVKVVNNHNMCTNQKSNVFYENIKNESKIRFYVFSGLKLINGTASYVYSFNKEIKDNSISPNLGAEISYILPNRKENSEIFSRIGFSSVNFDQSKLYSSTSDLFVRNEGYKFESNILGFSVGYRYYLNSLSDNKKGNLGFDFLVNSSIPLSRRFIYKYEFVGLPQYFEADFSNFVSDVIFDLSAGVTYTYLKKYSIELRYTFNTDYSESPVAQANFPNLFIGFKYLIFQRNK